MRTLVAAFLAIFCGIFGVAAAQSPPARAALHVVLVIDGLRPDSINPQDTPNLHRLRTEGVSFANSHAVFPTVTRVNSAALATGTYPDRNGLMGNLVYIPAVDPKHAFNNDDASMLLKLGDRILTVPSLAERMQAAGEKFVAVSSGSTGSALLMAPRAPSGAGVVINGYFAGQASFPREPGEEIVKRFGAAPKKGGAADPYDDAMDWGMKALTEYVLPEMKPRVAFSWLTEPDHIQHGKGAGSPEAIASIRRDDAQVGALLKKLADLGLQDRTDIVVVSDHGFAQTVHNVNVAQELQDANLMEAGGDDVILASSGQAVAVHVKNRDRARIAAIVEFLQRQAWCGLVFTAAGGGAAHEGAVRGTFALEHVHLGGHERSPDIVFTFPWSSARNRHGVPGTEYNVVASGKTAAVTTDTANHGGIGTWTVRNTMIAWGPDFKRGAVVRTPVANVDVAPTILHLLGMRQGLAEMQGRPLLEALAEGPDEEQVPMETRTLQVTSGSYRAVLQTSEVAGRRYVDKGWRY
jgi:predicted AlkP superfamily pyrophosphatase or phosphodiesterase